MREYSYDGTLVQVLAGGAEGWRQHEELFVDLRSKKRCKLGRVPELTARESTATRRQRRPPTPFHCRAPVVAARRRRRRACAANSKRGAELARSTSPKSPKKRLGNAKFCPGGRRGARGSALAAGAGAARRHRVGVEPRASLGQDPSVFPARGRGGARARGPAGRFFIVVSARVLGEARKGPGGAHGLGGRGG